MRRQAFSVLELVGVLAILAILTSLLLPRITHVAQRQTIHQTINEAQITEAVIAFQGLNTALNAHMAQYGCLACQNGKPLIFPETYDAFDQVLLIEGFIEPEDTTDRRASDSPRAFRGIMLERRVTRLS